MIKHDLTVHKNSDIEFTLELLNNDNSDMNVSSYVAKLIARKTNNITSDTVLNFVCEIVGENEIHVKLKHDLTKDIVSHSGYYNIILYDDNQDVKYRLVEGRITFTETLDDN